MANYLSYAGLQTLVNSIKNNVKGWLGINTSSGSATKFLNEKGNFATVNGASPYDSTPADVSTSAASAGDSSYYARGNHVHRLPSSVALNSGTYPDMAVGKLAAVAIKATSSSTADLNSYNTSSSALVDGGLRVYTWGASSAPYVQNSPFNAAGILYVGGFGAGFTNQWAINRTTGDIYYRYCEYNGTNWLGWKKLTNLGQVGSPTNPVYINRDGAAQACGFSVNIGSTPVSGSNVLNIITT